MRQGMCGSKIKTVHVTASVKGEREGRRICRNSMFNIFRAKNLMRDSVRRIKEDLGAEYIHITGIIEDDMHVYFERSDGTAVVSFVNVDRALDYCLSLGLKLWLEFSYTPEALVSGEKKHMYMGGPCINLPDDMEKWRYLVRKLAEHLAERYSGLADSWIFSVRYALYAYYGVYTLEEYMRYYECTYREIRRFFPGIAIAGFGVELETVTESEGTALYQLLKILRTAYA